MRNNANYFEGWYFKHTCDGRSICFIPGICKSKNNEEAFIQVIFDNKSYYFKYDYKDIFINKEPFNVSIGDSFFSEEYIRIDMNKKDVSIKGKIYYTNLSKINTTKYAPNIMGPFSYVKNLECNHDIISMDHNLSGVIDIVDKGTLTKIDLENGKGYIEKDSRHSFS